MKTKHFLTLFPAVMVACVVAVSSSSCGNKETPPAKEPTKSELKQGPIVSAQKNSFDAVTAHLDPGGNLYLYLSTEQWLDGISAKASDLRQIVSAFPAVGDTERANINKGFDVVTRLLKRSGIEDVSGVGMSSIVREPGMYYSKMLVHHYPGKGSGFLWTMLGKQPHALTGLDMAPSNTALACFSDVDLPLVWSELQKQVTESGFPQAQEWLQKLPASFEQMTQLKWDAVLASLGGEFGIILSLNDSKQVAIPLPGSQGLQIPEPGLIIVVKVKDDTIFNRIDQALKGTGQVVSVDKPELKMRTMSLPLPLPIQLRPTVASSGGYLLIASTDDLIQEVLAVKAGQKPGLKSTDEFKHQAQGVPQAGNQFTFVSRRFGQVIYQIQQQMLTMQAGTSGENAWLKSFISPDRAPFAFNVSANTDEGWMSVGNGNQNPARALLLPVAVVPGMLAAIAIPNFVKARTTAQKNACINNLRQLDGAKQQWALEKGKSPADIPTWDDLKPYLGRGQGQILTCPAGGVYTINSVGTAPKCSIPGHSQPN